MLKRGSRDRSRPNSDYDINKYIRNMRLYRPETTTIDVWHCGRTLRIFRSTYCRKYEKHERIGEDAHETTSQLRQFEMFEREREKKRGRVSQASNVTSTCSIIVIFRLLLRPSAVAFRRHRANVSITHRYVEFSEKTYCRRREILRTRLRVPKRVCRVSRSLSSVLKEHSRVSIHMQHRKTLVYSPVRRHSIPLCSTITLSGIILFLSMNREREKSFETD